MAAASTTESAATTSAETPTSTTSTTSPAATPPTPSGTSNAAASTTETAATAMVPERVVPATYDLKLPEGYDVADAKAIAAMAKDQQWTLEEAQAALQASHDWQVRQRSELKARLHADPEVGGEHLAQAQQHALRVLDRFMPATEPAGIEFRALLNKTGYGDHPDVIRFLARIGKAMGEDTMVSRDRTQAVAETEPWTKFYGTKAS